MDSLLIIALIVIVLWILAFAFYFLIVRNQRALESEIEEVESLLADDQKEEDAH